MAAESGANADKIAKRAKELNLDAIHDTVHEMAKDEARHGQGFEFVQTLLQEVKTTDCISEIWCADRHRHTFYVCVYLPADNPFFQGR